MARRCGCASGICACVIIGDGGDTVVTGTGTAADPFVVGIGPTLESALEDMIAASIGDAITDAVADAGLTLTDNWVSYTPTLADATLGNGNIHGSYKKIGTLCVFEAVLSFGSTTTITTGGIARGPKIGLPLAGTGGTYVMFTARLLDESADKDYAWGATLVSGAGAGAVAYSGTGLLITPTVPFTWADNDLLIISGHYAVAA